MSEKTLTPKQIQDEINRLTSDMIRHDGNVLELKKQLNQTQAELDYEKDQSQKCMKELENLYPLLPPIISI